MNAKHAISSPSEAKKLSICIDGAARTKPRSDGTNMKAAHTAAVSSSCAATSENTFCTKPERTCASTAPRSMFTSSGTPSYVTSIGSSAFCLAGL